MADTLEERNRASAERLSALGDRLSEAELGAEIDAPWTAAGLFAHLAFWDRFVRERWRLAAERGQRTPMEVDDDVMDRVNDASLRQWMSIPPRVAVQECLDAATELDGFIAGIDEDIRADLVAEGRERLVDRSLHREEHLLTIEAAFPLG
jgi:Mycothiol maleylpyruvate isomerase N-terminal domain